MGSHPSESASVCLLFLFLLLVLAFSGDLVSYDLGPFILKPFIFILKELQTLAQLYCILRRAIRPKHLLERKVFITEFVDFSHESLQLISRLLQLLLEFLDFLQGLLSFIDFKIFPRAGEHILLFEFHEALAKVECVLSPRRQISAHVFGKLSEEVAILLVKDIEAVRFVRTHIQIVVSIGMVLLLWLLKVNSYLLDRGFVLHYHKLVFLHRQALSLHRRRQQSVFRVLAIVYVV